MNRIRLIISCIIVLAIAILSMVGVKPKTARTTNVQGAIKSKVTSNNNHFYLYDGKVYEGDRMNNGQYAHYSHYSHYSHSSHSSHSSHRSHYSSRY